MQIGFPPSPNLNAKSRASRAGWIAAALGVVWLVLDQRHQWAWSEQNIAVVVIAVLAAALLAIPLLNSVAGTVLRHLQTPSAIWRAIISIALGLAGFIYLFAAIYPIRSDMVPIYHDENMYLLQARMLSQGKLWLPHHALPQFFETFHVFVKPVYAAIYFPGTALMYVPGVWLRAPYWITSAAIASAILTVAYLVVTALLDGIAGILIVFLLVALNWYRYLGTMAMSHPAALLLGLVMIWAWSRWRRSMGPGWALLLGIAAGWCAITRPLDAVCFALPIGLAMLVQLARQPVRKTVATALLVAFAALPFLSLQLVFNKGVTGRWFDSPAEKYNRDYWPAASLHASSKTQLDQSPPTSLLQIQRYYKGFIVPQVEGYRNLNTWRLIRVRFELVTVKMLPSPLLLMLIPIGLLQIHRRQRWVLAAVLPLLLLCYLSYPFFLGQYALIVGPSLLFIALLGVEGWIELIGKSQAVLTRRTTIVRATFALSILTLAVTALPETQIVARRPRHAAAATTRPTLLLLRDVHHKLREIHEPAVVLFRFTAQDNFKDIHEEPVYNIDVVDPDLARVIRAHDLGLEQDRQLIDYYARTQPGRMFYLYLRQERELILWGRADELAREAMQGKLRYPAGAENGGG